MTADRSELEPYFTTMGWGAMNPTPDGHLADDGHDPTYGNQGISLGRQVYCCEVCGAGVIDIHTHVAWHRDADISRTEVSDGR